MLRAHRDFGAARDRRRPSPTPGCESRWDGSPRAFDRRAGRTVLRRRRVLQPRQSRVSGQSVSDACSVRTPTACSSACYFPMPFFRSARIELVGAVSRFPTFGGRRDVHPIATRRITSAISTRRTAIIPIPMTGEDLVLLDTRETEGGGDWSGSFVGTSLHLLTRRQPRHARRRSALLSSTTARRHKAQGTGTEEWGGGGDYWGGRT